MTYHFTWWVTSPLLLSSIFTLMTPFPVGPVLHDHSPWLRYCDYWGCASWLISDSFLTHIILHAGRIFQQWHHNHIVCLVVESALHVYKGQFSPWFGQFTIQISQEFTMGILIQWKFIISASGTVLSKRLTSRLGVSKTLRFGLNLTSSLCISLTFRFC